MGTRVRISGRRSGWFQAVAVLGLAVLLGIAPRAAAVEVGDVAPRLVLPSREGVSYDLQGALKEHLVLLAFESPRCRPCLESRPALEELCQLYGTGGKLEVVSVMLGLGSAAPPAFAERILSGDEAVASAYGVFGTPVFFLVGRQGTILWKHVGRLTPGTPCEILSTALAEDPAPTGTVTR